MWFEEGLAYDNARLPQALILTGIATGTPAYIEAGLRSLRWLMTLQTSAGVFRPVGTRGFGDKRTRRGMFDQQPLEATATISACLAAWRADGSPKWKADAARAFSWFLGNNDLSLPLIDLETGSCRDGLHPDRVNENKGGESVVSYLLSLAEIRQLHRIMVSRAKFLPRFRAKSRRNRTQDQGAHLSQIQFLNRQALYLRPDPARVIVRPFKPATEPRDLNPTDKTRANHIVDRVLALGAETAAANSRMSWKTSRDDTATCWQIRGPRRGNGGTPLPLMPDFSLIQRQLIGAYFLHEYSFEAAALFNPSIVAHPDQSGAPEGGLRFILSLRAVGEGHVSSLTFRCRLHRGEWRRDRRSDVAYCHNSHVRDRQFRQCGQSSRADLRALRRYQRTGDLSRSRKPIGMASRTPASWSSTMMASEFSTPPTPPIAVTRYDRNCWRQPTSSIFRLLAPHRDRRAKQGHGAVPAEDQRQVRHDRAAGQRESLSRLFGRSRIPGMAERRS